MKTVLALSGISYGNFRGFRDWRGTFGNIKQNILDPINPDVYLCTYPSDTSVELMKSYNPKKALFIPYENSDARLTYKRTLELLLDVDFDLAITTRYDIKFNQNYPVYNFSFNSEKVNLAFKEKGWWEAHRYTADPQNFCIFPKKYLTTIIETIQEIYEKPHRPGHMDMHPFYSYISPKIGEENLNLIFNDEAHSHDNKYYMFERVKGF